MKTTDKVISLDLAKSIAKAAEEKGVKLPESERIWRWTNPVNKQWVLLDEKYLQQGLLSFPAYDVAELGEMLAKAFRNLSGKMINEPRGYFKRAWERITGFDNEAENRGKLLFYLIENDLLK